ncbi:MAG: OmpH family outer membrane protein [Bacteroidota bacterium]|jgi:outer membrane protein|nr:OmpH family outer membrane protein [Bacteroidota bacterium]HHU96601.1 OmpH family outer membrane protein [Petrimonas sp.]
MLKKLLIVCIALAPMAVMAQNLKIGYINPQEVFAAMPELSDIETKLSDKQEEINKNGQALIDEYNKKLEEFENNPATSEALQQDQLKQLTQLQERFQVYQQNSQQELARLQQELLEPVNRKIQEAIQAVGAENNFTYILDAAAIMYVNPSAENITQLVKTRLGI